jgi:hypothetical protein
MLDKYCAASYGSTADGVVKDGTWLGSRAISSCCATHQSNAAATSLL